MLHRQRNDVGHGPTTFQASIIYPLRHTKGLVLLNRIRSAIADSNVPPLQYHMDV